MLMQIAGAPRLSQWHGDEPLTLLVRNPGTEYIPDPVGIGVTKRRNLLSITVRWDVLPPGFGTHWMGGADLYGIRNNGLPGFLFISQAASGDFIAEWLDNSTGDNPPTFGFGPAWITADGTSYTISCPASLLHFKPQTVRFGAGNISEPNLYQGVGWEATLDHGKEPGS